MRAAALRVAVISTVLNEGENITRLLDSLVRQTRQPDEVIFVDGGSRDNTVAHIENYTDRLPLHVIVQPGCNISEGRNIAIAAASAEIIAATDAGVTLEAEWLAELVAPFERDPSCQVTAGFFKADPHNAFETAMGATVLPLADEIDPAGFLPSSRSVAFRKSAWQVVGGYPEWLDYCEDLIFDLGLKQHSPDFAFAPRAVAHFRPRGSLRAFYKQYYLYARGDGKADLWRKRHAIRYLTYLVLLPALLLLGLRSDRRLWLLLGLGGAFYVQRPYRRLASLWPAAPDRSPVAALKMLALIPVIRLVGDIAKMIGYPVGWWWRIRHRPPNWRESIVKREESA